VLASRTARQASGRGIVLLPPAALLVHQLRYWLTYGPRAETQLADQGHAYLGSFVPWVAMLSGAGLAVFLARLARGRVSETPRRRFGAVWSGAFAGLLAIYALQEALEGIFATGHPGGLPGIFGHGGWWAVPAAVVVALVLACLLRVADALVRFAARGREAARRTAPALPRLQRTTLPRRRPLASAAAGRAPPILLA
jgi:hypothetical protein